MKKNIDSYIRFINNFELAFKKKYKGKKDIWTEIDKTIPRKGGVFNYGYYFHGKGCRVEYNNTICEYDFGLLEGKVINFSIWKLYKFIETNPELSNVSMDDVYFGTLGLINEGIVSRFILSGIDTKTYSIDKNYIDRILYPY
ncbi:DUF6896 domain-containing protein [Tenacibaculum discolor]|uniref:DUF6896 domain-containing protein n=1 Tax=Tenacibaculum discolor TaxID=361581 RepID=UPI000F58FB71|nr:hypothetical protein [Tenacibaculum discolor]